jgi:hypothetical protein
VVPGKDGAKAALFSHGPAPHPRYVRTALNIRHSPQTLVGPFRAHKRKNAAALDRTPPQAGYIGSISPGRQVLLNQGSSGPYSRKRVFQPFPGIVCTQFASLPEGAFGPK